MQDEQFGLNLGDAPKAGPVTFDPDDIREDMMAILNTARNAIDASPWDESAFRYNKILFPLLGQWLPGDEAAQLCFEFAREIERIELLMAA